MLIAKKGILCIKPEGLSDEISSFVTKKYSGYSKGVYSSLNMALHVGDNCLNVLKNIELFKASFGIDTLVTLLQVHGSKVIEVNKYNIVDCLHAEADGLFTLDRGIALGILTADCFNLQLIGNKGIANLHCGWKSVADDIIEKALNIFRKHDDYPVQAVLGPGICGDCYEVGHEVAEALEKISPGGTFTTIINDKIHLSIRGAIEKYLVHSDINDIIHIDACSSCDPNLFSYRRDKGETGRMLSVVMRKNV